MTMNRRRFMLLAVALVAVNSFFWLAQGGFALAARGDQPVLRAADDPRRGARADANGPRTGGSTAASSPASTGTTLTLREGDGTTVTLDISPTARIQGGGRIANVGQLKRRLRVVVYHQANLPAEVVQVEGVGS